ncbi:MAG: hypothetical protein SF123_21970 [Chloroflexota bacterium]|nr:hypothetical protein [Chloroflexota bacterium]
MKLESVLALKQQVLTEVDEKFGVNSNAPEAEQLLSQKPGDRVAVGYSQIAKNNFRLELRVQRHDQWAYTFAETVVEEVNGEANVEVIPVIEIPSGKDTKEANRCSPIIDRDAGALQIGLSIGPKDSGIGTLGAFISRRDGDYVLSCNHVMVRKKGASILKGHERGDSIYHPGRERNYRLDATREIGCLSNYLPLSEVEENDLDCAIAKLDSGWSYDGTSIPTGLSYPNEGKSISIMTNPDERLQRDMVVSKIGRTTCHTQGLVRAVDIDRLTVNMAGAGKLLFRNVFEIRSTTKEKPFSLPGDSGSLVFSEDGLEAIGLVFAGGYRDDGYKLTYVCKLQPILDWAEAKLLN